MPSALKLREETLALRRTKLGPDHPDTLISMINLADGYLQLGRFSEAVKLNEETLALCKSKLGGSHPDTLECMGAWLTIMLPWAGTPRRCSFVRRHSPFARPNSVPSTRRRSRA